MTERKGSTPSDHPPTKDSSAETDWQENRRKILESGEYDQELWDLVEKFAEDLLIKGRPDFDVPHTRGVVSWAYDLVKAYNQEDTTEEPVDLVVLLTAAWLHDIGYYGQFDEVAGYDEVQDKKAMHMIVGSKMAEEFLSAHAGHLLSAEQIAQVVNLVSVHDNLDIISLLQRLC